MNRLTLQVSQRKIGASQTPRTFYDFFIDGVSLKLLLHSEDADLISPFGWGVKDYQNKIINEFRLTSKPELNSGRTMIYVCPECGDITCGAITAKITTQGDVIIWSDFAFENGESINNDNFNDIEPLEFNKQQYQKVFDEIK